MDKVLSVHQNKATKQTKTKKRPVKVVYISNPMKVKTSASEFRALVQELTGRDADMPDPTKYSEIVGVGECEHHQMIPDAMKVSDDHALVVSAVDPSCELPKKSDLLFEPYDDVFTPQMLENFSGLLPSSLSYESAHVDVLRSLDTM